MEKVKKKRMLIPVEHEDAFSLEAYFEEMSRQGLHFSDFRGYGVFIQGECKSYRYRLEPYDKNKYWPDYEKVNYYEENGWELVNKFGNMYEVYRSLDPSAPELHSETVSESYAYDDLLKRMRSDMIGNIFSSVFIPIGLMAIYMFAPEPTMLLIKTSSVLVPVVVICTFFITKKSISKYKAIKRIKTTLADGIEVRENSEPKLLPMWKVRLSFWGNMAVIAVLLVLTTMNYIPGRQFTLHSGDSEIYPFVPLHELVEGEVEIPYSLYRNFNMYSHGREDSSFLAKNIYTFYQSGYENVYDMDGDILGGEYDNGREFASAQTYFYDLNFEFLAKSLAEDIMQEYTGFVFKKIEDGRFDLLYIGDYAEDEQSDSRFLVAVKGSKVMAINLRSGTPIENSIDEIAAVFER